MLLKTKFLQILILVITYMANKSEESNWTKQIYPYRNISTKSIINITSHETEECKDFDIKLPIFEITGNFCKIETGNIVGNFSLDFDLYFLFGYISFDLNNNTCFSSKLALSVLFTDTYNATLQLFCF
ncbi:13512_t:CDS:2 [Dentiscutata erythropus]|uniref:13512_t:CDS:1 n=1 Tax=Dentiscutata erythropus TaxID=1348616 RepID=A0A9N8V7N6_9GLOM|nr:13512_t:CDS:2 [Dentiscutata erythropus]